MYGNLNMRNSRLTSFLQWIQSRLYTDRPDAVLTPNRVNSSHLDFSVYSILAVAAAPRSGLLQQNS